jgi:hypothetical protein
MHIKEKEINIKIKVIPNVDNVLFAIFEYGKLYGFYI